MIVGPKQTLFVGDLTAATHFTGDTTDAGATNVTVSNPLVGTTTAFCTLFRFWCTGPGAGGTLLLSGTPIISFSGLAGGSAAVQPGGGSGVSAGFETVDVHPTAAFALASFSSQPLAGGMIMRPRNGAANVHAMGFASPNMFVGLIVGANAITGLTVEARCLYWNTTDHSNVQINEGIPPLSTRVIF